MSVLAHRGANRIARENTVAAFRAAADLGADGVELDVRATAEGTVVVHHDASVDGLGPLGGLADASLPSWLPTLAQALEACAGFALVNVEIKADPETPALGGVALAAAVAEELSARPAQPRLLVSSFDLATIDAHLAAAPALATGWLCAVPIDASEAAAMVADRGHVAFHPHHLLVTAPLVAAAHLRGLDVVAWTVDDPARGAELVGLGVDVLISNVPDVVRPRS